MSGAGSGRGMDFGGRIERKRFQVESDGNPPVIHRARMMVREASGRLFGVNLGGIAEAMLLSQVWDESIFCCRVSGKDPAHLPPEF